MCKVRNMHFQLHKFFILSMDQHAIILSSNPQLQITKIAIQSFEIGVEAQPLRESKVKIMLLFKQSHIPCPIMFITIEPRMVHIHKPRLKYWSSD